MLSDKLFIRFQESQAANELAGLAGVFAATDLRLANQLRYALKTVDLHQQLKTLWHLHFGIHRDSPDGEVLNLTRGVSVSGGTLEETTSMVPRHPGELPLLANLSDLEAEILKSGLDPGVLEHLAVFVVRNTDLIAIASLGHPAPKNGSKNGASVLASVNGDRRFSADLVFHFNSQPGQAGVDDPALSRAFLRFESGLNGTF